MSIPCAGIIVFNNISDLDFETILVNTKVGNFSFPKGGRHKLETPIEAAWRELKEETGLTQEHVTLIDEDFIDELSNKGFASVRYFVGYLTQKKPIITFDKDELEQACWYSIKDALEIKKFKNARKEILIKAYEKYKFQIKNQIKKID